jgi:hypothetical protein
MVLDEKPNQFDGFLDADKDNMMKAYSDEPRGIF